MPKVGFVNSSGTDLGDSLVPKTYLIDRYPELLDNFRFAGLWAWGYNIYGQLGDNSQSDKSSPVQTVSSGANWKQVSGGGAHTTAIKTDGTLWTWGHNNFGQLGDNSIANKSSPVQTIAGGNNWKLVAGSSYHTLAIKTDGTLWGWGYNTYGQLGDNSRANKSSPVQTAAGGTNWKQVAAQDHTVAIKTDGTLWVWGRNIFGQLGTNDITNYSSPVQTISGGTNWKSIFSTMAGYHTVAIKTDGTLWTWGRNTYGQLGDNTITHRSSPVQTIAGGTNWQQAASHDSTAAIKTDGTLWLWGKNGNGELGNNSTTNVSSPIQTISGGTNWKLVSSGWYLNAAIKTDGTLWTWGKNTNFALGDTTSISKSSPIQTVAGGTNWKQVSCGWFNTYAIRDNSDDYI